jgi:hypothetical protein
MSRERWGTFSVTDHLRPRPFVAEVLLYDRLIVPVPSDDREREYWRDKERHWDPDLQEQLLNLMGDRVIRIPWDQAKREVFTTKFAAAKAAAFATNNLAEAKKSNSDPMYVTRMLLAQDFLPPMPEGVYAWPIAAYPSCSDYREDLARNPAVERQERLAMVLTHRFLVPESPGSTDQEMLKKAVGFAKRDDFQEKRLKFYRWQEDIIEKGIPDEKAVEEMEQHLKNFEDIARKAKMDVYWKFAFMAVPVAISIATAGLGAPLIVAGASGLISVAAFVKFDRKPSIDGGDCEAAAMIHDVQERFEWK